MEYAREKYGIDEAHCFADYHDLINCPDVDVIDISTSNNAHFEVAKAAIEAGKPYAIEKPVTMTAEEADILARMTAEKNLKKYGFVFLSLQSGGPLYEGYHRPGPLSVRFTTCTCNIYRRAAARSGTCPGLGATSRSLQGTGALGDLGCHALDLVSFVTGKDYVKAVGHADTFTKMRKLEEGRRSWRGWMWMISATT